MELYCTATNVANILSVTLSHSHTSSSALAVVTTDTIQLDIGDYMEIDMGYVDNHDIVFRGYVKAINYEVPNGTYTITANDLLVQALDYFIVSSNPATPLTYGGGAGSISAEALVEDLLELAGITSYDYDATSFSFGSANEFEISLVSSYDFASRIADLLTWHIWCDETGTVNFKNRKPFVITDADSLDQPGLVDDTDTTGFTWSDAFIISGTVHTDEKDLRNRVVVWGTNNLYAEAKDESSPYYHWKTTVLGAQDMLDTQDAVDTTAEYNLYLFNKVKESLTLTALGDPKLLPHRCTTVNSTKLDISGQLYYIFAAEHNFSDAGYTVTLELVK